MSIFNLFKSQPEPEKAFLNLTRNEKLVILQDHGASILAQAQRVDLNALLREGYETRAEHVADTILSRRLIAEIQSEIAKEKADNAEKEVGRLLEQKRKKK